jgi:hypothetical protein
MITAILLPDGDANLNRFFNEMQQKSARGEIVNQVLRSIGTVDVSALAAGHGEWPDRRSLLQRESRFTCMDGLVPANRVIRERRYAFPGQDSPRTAAAVSGLDFRSRIPSTFSPFSRVSAS